MDVYQDNILTDLQGQGHMSKVKVRELKKWSVFLLPQTMCDGDEDCKANPFVFIITIPALAHILHAKCLPYTVYFPFEI